MAGGATQPANGAGGGTTRSSHGKHSRAPQPQDHQSVDRESLWTTTELMLFVGSMSCLCTFLTLAASCGVFFLTNATRPANQRVWHPFQSSITTLGTAVPGANQGLDVAGSSTGASTSVWVPVRFKDHVDVSGALPPHLAPQTLFAVVGGQPPAAAPLIQFHWVITSCDRYHWGRMMSSTLLSGLLNGLQPATISVVWCQAFDRSKVPSLLLNLRHSHSVNVFFPNTQLLGSGQVRNAEATYLTALMVPRALGMAHLPLLITEDDIWVAPDANVRLRAAVRRVEQEAGKAPFLMQCYQADGVGPAPEVASGIMQPLDDLDGGGAKAWRSHTSKGEGIHIVHTLNYGAQANFFSAAMTAMMLSEWLKFVQPGQNHTDRLQDMHVVHMVENQWGCNRLYRDCYYYTMYPSLVQHLGTSSSLFNKDDKGVDHKLNQRWHVARDYPVHLEMIGYDPDGLWRRLLRRRRRSNRKLLAGASA